MTPNSELVGSALDAVTLVCAVGSALAVMAILWLRKHRPGTRPAPTANRPTDSSARRHESQGEPVAGFVQALRALEHLGELDDLLLAGGVLSLTTKSGTISIQVERAQAEQPQQTRVAETASR